MNQPIEVKPADGPLTVYVVAVLFERRVSPDGRHGVGFGGESVLLQVQMAEPGDRRAPADGAGAQHQHGRRG